MCPAAAPSTGTAGLSTRMSIQKSSQSSTHTLNIKAYISSCTVVSTISTQYRGILYAQPCSCTSTARQQPPFSRLSPLSDVRWQVTLADPDITPPHGTRTGLRSPSPRAPHVTHVSQRGPNRTPRLKGGLLQSYNLHGTSRRLVVLLLAKLHPIGIPRCASRAATAVVTRLCQPVGLPRRKI